MRCQLRPVVCCANGGRECLSPVDALAYHHWVKSTGFAHTQVLPLGSSRTGANRWSGRRACGPIDCDNTQTSAPPLHTCGLTLDNQLICFGANGTQQRPAETLKKSRRWRWSRTPCAIIRIGEFNAGLEQFGRHAIDESAHFYDNWVQIDSGKSTHARYKTMQPRMLWPKTMNSTGSNASVRSVHAGVTIAVQWMRAFAWLLARRSRSVLAP